MNNSPYAQYLQLKRHQPAQIPLVPFGDFYLTYADDAAKVATACNFALTSQLVAPNTRIPFVGFPAYNADHYRHLIIAAGHTLCPAPIMLKNGINPICPQ